MQDALSTKEVLKDPRSTMKSSWADSNESKAAVEHAS